MMLYIKNADIFFKKKKNEFMILKNINLNVTENCILGILGNNGAGKTTLFKTIVGLHQKFIGQIKVFDTDISTDKSFLNRVGFIPDISQIPGWYRGIDFLNLYLRLKGVDDIENRIRENITKFSLKDKINQRINTYSKGQKKDYF